MRSARATPRRRRASWPVRSTRGAAPIAIIGALAASLKPLVAGAELVARGRSVDEALRELAVAPYQRVRVPARATRLSPARSCVAPTASSPTSISRARAAATARALLELWTLRVCVGAPIAAAAAARRP